MRINFVGEDYRIFHAVDETLVPRRGDRINVGQVDHMWEVRLVIWDYWNSDATQVFVHCIRLDNIPLDHDGRLIDRVGAWHWKHQDEKRERERQERQERQQAANAQE